MMFKKQKVVAYKSQEKKLIIMSFFVAGIMLLSLVGRIFGT